MIADSTGRNGRRVVFFHFDAARGCIDDPDPGVRLAMHDDFVLGGRHGRSISLHGQSETLQMLQCTGRT